MPEFGPEDFETLDIDSVAVEPDHCHRCGAALETCTFEGTEHPWCPECRLVLSRNPVPGVHVVVHDDAEVLVLDEPIPQHDGVLSLPGGHANPDEHPKAAGLRELQEETGLSADPDDLEFLTILHAEFHGYALYLITYRIDRADVRGDIDPERDDFTVAFRSLDELRTSNDRIRDSDLDRIEQAFASGGRAERGAGR